MVFKDDILIYSNTREEHEQHFRMTFQVLREHQLYAKFSKCQLRLRPVTFVGHYVFHHRVDVDLKNIKALMNWSRPLTPTDI